MTASPANNGFVQCPNGFAAPAWAFLSWPRRGLAKWIKNGINGLFPCMPPVRTSTRPTVGQLAKAQTFRFLTMLATWVLIFAAFVYEPGWIRDSLRFMTHSIESLADQVPEPWGARLEIMLRELGGMIWIQIASAIVLLRLIIWVPFHLWRLRRERRISYRTG